MQLLCEKLKVSFPQTRLILESNKGSLKVDFL